MAIADIAASLGIEGSTDLTTFKVKLNGVVVDQVISLSIDRGINRIPKAYVLFADGDPSKEKFELSELSNFDPGTSVEITMGYSNLESTVFKGVLVRQSIKISSTESALEMICMDPCYRMSLSCKSNYFKDVTDKDIIEEIAEKYQDVSVSSPLGLGSLTSGKHAEVIQHNVSDWDFIVARAEQAGFYITVLDGDIKLNSISPIVLPDIVVSYGMNIFSMDLQLDSDSQFESYVCKSWSDERLEMIEEEASTGGIPDPGSSSADDCAAVGKEEYIITHAGNVSTDQLKLWADGIKVKSQLSKIKGTVSFQGTPKALPGASIKLDGLGSRFNGTTLISGVLHELKDATWICTAQLGFDPKWHTERYGVTKKPQSISGADVAGLYTGIVRQTHDDPEGRERILVNIPAVDPDSEGSWMRWSSLDAGEAKGFVNRPDVGDEVVVGFINADLNQGVVLGALYSKVNPPGELLPAEEGNHKKGWILKEGLHVLIDRENDVIEILTSAGNTIKISDEDKKIEIIDMSSNEWIMDENGVQVSTPKDFVITAQGDVKIEGMNVEITAQTGFTAKGTTAEINGSGMTTIKGNPVNIN